MSPLLAVVAWQDVVLLFVRVSLAASSEAFVSCCRKGSDHLYCLRILLLLLLLVTVLAMIVTVIVVDVVVGISDGAALVVVVVDAVGIFADGADVVVVDDVVAVVPACSSLSSSSSCLVDVDHCCPCRPSSQLLL